MRIALGAVLAAMASASFPILNDLEDATINDPTCNRYRETQTELNNASSIILATCEEQQREPTVEEQTTIRNNTAEIVRLQGLIDVRAGVLNQSAQLRAPQPRATTPTATPANNGAQPAPQPAFAAARDLGPSNLKPAVRNHGFESLGHFALAVKRQTLGQGQDQRLLNAAATTVASEGDAVGGGSLVPPEYRDAIFATVFDTNNLLARTDQQITSRNAVSFPVSENTPWGGAGVMVYWEGEGAAIGQSRPTFRNMDLKTNKLAALVPITDELLEDAPSMGNFIQGAAGRGFNWAIANAIIDGTGAGQPLGFLRSQALVTVAAEGGQAADTVVPQNLAKMYARMPAESRARAIWLMNPDIESQLITMTLGGTAAAFPVYMPPNGMSASPFATILGRQAIPHLACKAIGDVGDISFVDLGQYVTLTKTGGIKSDVSMHLWFDQMLSAFRFSFRVDGRPWLSAAIDAPNSSQNISPFVTLGAR